MYITLILFFLIGFLLNRKNIISQTSKFLILEGYKSVDLIGPTFKLLSEGLYLLNLSRFMVSGFFGRKVSVSGAQCIISFYVVIAQSVLSAVTFAFGQMYVRIFNNRDETLKFSDFVTRRVGVPTKRHNVNYMLRNKVNFSKNRYVQDLVDSNNLKNKKVNLNPNWITGFSCSPWGKGEASFKISIYARGDCKTGWWISPTFVLEVHYKDAYLLHQIKALFGVGNIVVRKSNGQVMYIVASVKDLIEVIIPHFDRYPLLIKKWEYYFLFKSAVELISNKNHLTLEGIREIVSIRAVMNLGLTDILRDSFPDVIPKERLVNEYKGIYSPYWFTGFVEAEGCFWVSVHQSKSYKIGYQTQLYFVVSQHNRYVELLNSFISYLDCGKVVVKGYNNSVEYKYTKLADLEEKVLPFFFFRKKNIVYFVVKMKNLWTLIKCFY